MGARWRVQQAAADSRTKRSEFVAIFGLVDRLPPVCQTRAERAVEIAERNAEIRERYANGETQKKLAADYLLNFSTVSHICNGVEKRIRFERKAERNAEIRGRYTEGETQAQLALDYGLTQQAIGLICKGLRTEPKSKLAPAEIQARNAEIRERYFNGEMQKKLAADYNLDKSLVSRICKGVERKVKPKNAQNPEKQARNAEICKRYANGEAQVKLAADYGIGASLVSRICKEVERKANPKEQRNAEIRERYANGESHKEITAAFGISRTSVWHICKEVERKVNPKEQRNAEIRERYANGETQTKIAEDFGINRATVLRICKGVEGKVRLERKAERNAEIRERYAQGEERKKIAGDFGICQMTVSRICKGVERRPEERSWSAQD